MIYAGCPRSNQLPKFILFMNRITRISSRRNFAAALILLGNLWLATAAEPEAPPLISIEALTEKASKVKIRIGLIGDENKSHILMNALEKRL